MPTKKIFDIYPPKTIDKKRTKKAKDEKVLPGKKTFYSTAKKKVTFFGFSNEQNRVLPRRRVFIIGLTALIAIVFFLHISSRLEIEIWPKTEILSFEKDLIIDSKAQDSNFSKSIILGQFFSEADELSSEFSSSGILKKQTKATGVIRVFNDYHLPQPLVSNTRFISATGKLFYSQEYINAPAGETWDVSVVAAEPGPEYNIKPTTFSIPGLLGTPRYTVVYGKSLSQMEGGAIVEVSQVTKEDFKKAEEIILDKLKVRLKEKLNNKAGDLFILLEEAIETKVLEKSSTKKEEEEAEKFDFYVKASANALVFKDTYVKDFAQKWILEQMPEGKEIKPQSLTQEYVLKNIDVLKGKMHLKIKIYAEIFTSINEQALKDSLSGKSIKESKVLLESMQEIEKSKLRLFPFWVKRIPDDMSRIKAILRL